MASWYGEEFAGRTTANGEIFDPTAAHGRTPHLPFGTVLDITNPKTGADRARARQRPRAVHRQPPDRPLVRRRAADRPDRAGSRRRSTSTSSASAAASANRRRRSTSRSPRRRRPRRCRSAADAAAGRFPAARRSASVGSRARADRGATRSSPSIDRVTVETQRGDVITRKQVAADGRTLEEVPVAPAATATTASSPRRAAQAHRDRTAPLEPRAVHRAGGRVRGRSQRQIAAGAADRDRPARLHRPRRRSTASASDRSPRREQAWPTRALRSRRAGSRR